MESLIEPTGRVLLRLAMQDKTGWRLNYLYECGLISKEDLELLNAR